MQFLVDNMSARELRRWINRRSNFLQSCRTQGGDTGQSTSMEDQRKELAFICRHVFSMERLKQRNEGSGWLPRPDDPGFSSALEKLVRATLLARQLSMFGAAVRKRPSELSQAMWRKVGEEFNDDDVLHGGYKDR